MLWDDAGLQGESGDFVGDIIELPPNWNNRAGSMEAVDLQQAPA